MSDSSEFKLTENEKDLLKENLNIFNSLIDNPSEARIDLTQDRLADHLANEASRYEVGIERIDDIMENVIDPLYSNREHPTFTELNLKLREHGVDVPEITNDVGAEDVPDVDDPGGEKQAYSEQERKAPNDSKGAPDLKKKDSTKYQAPDQLGLTPEQKYDVEREIRQQKREMKNAALSNPASLLGQSGALFFRGVQNLFENVVLGKAWKKQEIGPFKPSLRRPKEVVSSNDYVNGCKSMMSSIENQAKANALTEDGFLAAMESIKNSSGNIQSNSADSKAEKSDQALIDHSMKSLDKTLSESGFYEKSPDSKKKLEEVAENFKKLFEGLFKKKDKDIDQPSPG